MQHFVMHRKENGYSLHFSNSLHLLHFMNVKSWEEQFM